MPGELGLFPTNRRFLYVIARGGIPKDDSALMSVGGGQGGGLLVSIFRSPATLAPAGSPCCHQAVRDLTGGLIGRGRRFRAGASGPAAIGQRTVPPAAAAGAARGGGNGSGGGAFSAVWRPPVVNTGLTAASGAKGEAGQDDYGLGPSVVAEPIVNAVALAGACAKT